MASVIYAIILAPPVRTAGLQTALPAALGFTYRMAYPSAWPPVHLDLLQTRQLGHVLVQQGLLLS